MHHHLLSSNRRLLHANQVIRTIQAPSRLQQIPRHLFLQYPNRQPSSAIRQQNKAPRRRNPYIPLRSIFSNQVRGTYTHRVCRPQQNMKFHDQFQVIVR